MIDAVAKRSAQSAGMVASATKGRDLMGGTAAMRSAAKTYLPIMPAESEEGYQARLSQSWLFNAYANTVGSMTGKVFSVPVEPGDETPPAMVEWLANADLQGRDLSTFARAVFEDGVSGSGISYIMVDAPVRSGVVTQSEAYSQGLRPYMVHLRVDDILGWKTTVIANVTVLSQVRIMEKLCEPSPTDEFTDVEIEQIRVLDRMEKGVQVRLYRKGRDKNWTLYDEPRLTGLDEITIVPFYANRTGFFTGAPMLDDLADVNIAHWQSQSDQRNILHVARVPLLFGAGFAEQDKLVISSQTATLSSNENASLAWVEISGASIAAGRQDLKDIEFQMETFGLQLTTARPGAQSATGEALDADKETSTLSMTADALKDCLEQALIWMAEYGGLGEIMPDVAVNKDYGVNLMGAQDMLAMLAAVNTGAVSRETFLREMARRGMVRADLDPLDEAERIALEGGAGGGQ